MGYPDLMWIIERKEQFFGSFSIDGDKLYKFYSSLLSAEIDVIWTREMKELIKTRLLFPNLGHSRFRKKFETSFTAAYVGNPQGNDVAERVIDIPLNESVSGTTETE